MGWFFGVCIMGEDQNEIYYVIGEDLESVKLSPHLDTFKSQELDVLYFVDPIDPFVLQFLSEYNDIPLRNIDDASLEFPNGEDKDKDEKYVGQEKPDFNRLIGRFVTTLGDRVLEVRESKTLRESPIRLVSPADSPTRDLQRIQRYMTDNYEVPKKILEVNREHRLMADLSTLIRYQPDDEIIDLTILQLYENALLIEGLHPNPTQMMPRVERLIELAAARSVLDEEE